ncbi:hypothetical protein FQZ97_921530 [compost metagenome]
MNQALFQRALLLLLHEHVATDEIVLGEVDHEAEADLQWGVGVVDVDAKVSVAFLQAKAFQRHQPCVYEWNALGFETFNQRAISAVAVFRWNVKLVAQLAHVGDANQQNARVTKLDFTTGPERHCLGGEVGAGDLLQQVTGQRALQAKKRVGRGDIGNGAELTFMGVLSQPAGSDALQHVSSHQHVLLLGKSGDRQVGDNSTLHV